MHITSGISGHLLAALIQSFAVIIIGYLVGQLGVISDTMHERLALYLSRVALPAMIFHSMVTLNFGDVNVNFWISVLVGKTILFATVIVVAYITERHWGKVGLYAIAVTQTNDFALCYPVVTAIFGASHPEFADYLFLFAPISFMFLNPIGFGMLELGKWRDLSPEDRGSGTRAVVTFIQGVIVNPIVFMTVLGVGCNLMVRQQIPDVIITAFHFVGATFSIPALFYMGLTMAGQIHVDARSLVVPAWLVCAKLLVLPILIRTVAGHMLLNQDSNKDYHDFTAYAFLYGITPAAPPVYLYASQYGIAVQEVGTSLVAGTFFSAPLIFLSTKMIPEHDHLLLSGITCIAIVLAVTMTPAAAVFCEASSSESDDCTENKPGEDVENS